MLKMYKITEIEVKITINHVKKSAKSANKTN